MIRSFLITQQFDIGVDTENLVTVQITLPNTRYPQPADRLAFQERMTERLEGLPGVESLTIVSNPPAGGAQMRTLKIEGREMVDENNRLPTVARIIVVPEYFASLDLSDEAWPRVHRNGWRGGRRSGDRQRGVRGAVFSGRGPARGSPASRRRPGSRHRRPLRALAHDHRREPAGFSAEPEPGLERPADGLCAVPPGAAGRLHRSRTNRGWPGTAVVAGIRNELRQLDADLPLFNIRTMDDILAQRNWPYRIFGTLFAHVRRRRAADLVGRHLRRRPRMASVSEGKRSACAWRSAPGRRDILWLVLRHGITRICIGVVLGVLAALGVSRVLSSVLVNTTATDPATFVSIACCSPS